MASMEEQIGFLKTAVLSEKRSSLCQNITPKAHYPYLRSRYVLSEDDEELIEAQQTRKQKVHKFVDLLVTKGSRGFDEFVRSLIQERTQLFIAEELNRAFEEKKRRLEVLISQQDTTEMVKNVPDSTTMNGTEPADKSGMFKESESFVTSSVLRSSNRTSVSDLGVDTESLPKPVMPKNLTSSLKSLDDSVRLSGEFVYHREKSIEENEDKSVKIVDSNRSRTTSNSSSSVA